MTITDDLEAEDAELNKRMETVHEDVKRALEIVMERHALYSKFEHRATDILIKNTISSMRESVFNQVLIFKLRADLEEDIAKIITRLDDLETKVQSLSQPKNR